MKKTYIIIIICLCALCFGMIFYTTLSSKKDAVTQDGDQKSVTLTDQTGRKVVIEKPVKRIISGYYVSTSALLALGLQDKIVAIETKSQSGKRALYGLCAKRLWSLPVMGTSKNFDVEKCIALKPDLVILPQRLSTFVPPLEKLGIKVLLVRPENFDECQEMIDLIARATGTENRAEKFRTFAKKQKDFLATLPKNGKQVYVTAVPSVIVTFGRNMSQSNMVALAGGKNVADEISDLLWVHISYEQLLAWNPEVIVIAADARFNEQDVLNDKHLVNCRAVKTGQVFKMPNYIEAWDTPIPAGILGSLWLASKLYPDKVSSEYFEKTVRQYYKEFYGFEYEK
ncbi:MAG: ABC transporter substrate-binding protein [Synergistaceae bacterium]|nr:ABC transporter substrate-binding protein [Synergistaceae bacterium]